MYINTEILDLGKKRKLNWGIHYLNWGNLALCSQDFNIAKKRLRILYDKKTNEKI